MKFKCQNITLGIAIALALSLLLTISGGCPPLAVQAQGPATYSQADVLTSTVDGEYDYEARVGFSNLVRKQDGLRIQLETSQLRAGGVYTYWWLVDEDLDPQDPTGLPYDLAVWGGYVIVKQHGKVSEHLTLNTGLAGITGNPTVFLDEGEAGLTNPYGSLVEVELVYQGLAEDLPQDPVEREAWLTTFWGGDEAVCNIPFPISPTGKSCPLAQLTVHEGLLD